jgi:hypothetical protein
MSRAFGAASAAAFIQPNVSVITFVMLDFASGIVRVHNSIGTYTWGGEDWIGVRIAWQRVSTRRRRRCFTVRNNTNFVCS